MGSSLEDRLDFASEKGGAEDRAAERRSASSGSEIDLFSFHERQQGRLIIDPEEARIELGDAVAAGLKLSSDGKKVLWPQPTDDPEDPQNWKDGRKLLQLIVITLASIIPDFDSSIGIAGIFSLAQQFHTSTNVINNMTSNWSIFLIGWGGLLAVMLVRRYGRLPVVFWSQVLGLAALVGATFAPSLASFTAFRCLNGFFATCPQVVGLYIITDVYPFHKQARMLNYWGIGLIGAPFLGPFALGFLVARASWRWAYGVGCIYGALVLLLIVFFLEETMYDRAIRPVPPRMSTGLRYRIETLLGVTGVNMAKYRATWRDVVLSPFNVVWRPQILGILIFEAILFGFAIGINVTMAVFLGTPPPAGFGYSPDAISGMYATPLIAVLIGELIGRYANDYIMNWSIRRNKGVFEAESRLWACYTAIPLYICGFLVLGGAIQHHLGPAAFVFGWGIAETAIMLNTVAVYAYCNDCFPKHKGEISALINLARTLGGFAVAYFQVPWALRSGALVTFGTEAAIVVGLFLLFVPVVQRKGRALRARFSL